jgi:hypothetical protein
MGFPVGEDREEQGQDACEEAAEKIGVVVEGEAERGLEEGDGGRRQAQGIMDSEKRRKKVERAEQTRPTLSRKAATRINRSKIRAVQKAIWKGWKGSMRKRLAGITRR